MKFIRGNIIESVKDVRMLFKVYFKGSRYVLLHKMIKINVELRLFTLK